MPDLKRSFFIPFGQLSLAKLSVIVAGVIVFWTALGEIIPARYYHTVTVILAAIQSALVFTIRSTSQQIGTRAEDPPKP
jgi:hypothetical protein